MSKTKKKLAAKAKFSKPVTRLTLPSNKRHKTAKDYKRVKVKPHEVADDER